VVKKHLTSIDVPYEFITLPPGEAGWRFVEQLTGARALPAIMKNGMSMELDEFKREVDSLGRIPRPLTQEELDGLD
jgi:hypothetical protein